MIRETRRATRFLMRAVYSATGFCIAILTAAVAHDGLTPDGTLPLVLRPLFVTITILWFFALTLDAATRTKD